MKGESITAIIGSDRPNPLPIVTYTEPRPKPTGLDWAAISSQPAPEDAPTPAEPKRKRGRCVTCGRVKYVDEACARCVELEEATRAAQIPQAQPELDEETIELNRAYASEVAEIVEKRFPTGPAPDRGYTSREVEFTELLRDTADHTNREVISARFLALAALEHLRLVASSSAIPPTTPTTAEAPRKRRSSTVVERLAEHGISSATVRVWAMANDVPHSKRGTVNVEALDAYLEAHQ